MADRGVVKPLSELVKLIDQEWLVKLILSDFITFN